MAKNTNTGFHAGLSENNVFCFLTFCFFLALGIPTNTLAEDAKDEAIAVHRGTSPYSNVGGSASQTPGLGSAAAGGVDNGGTGLSSLTAYSVLIGEGTAPVHFATPGNTGIPLVSTGAASDPAFGTALVLGGGTGRTSFSALNSLILSGTTTTSAMQQITGGAAGTILTSDGAATAPTFKTLRSTTQTFTSGTGATYTAPTGLVCAIVECVGGGGGGGGCAGTASFSSAGGGAGGYSRGVLTAAQIAGGTGLYTVGAGGTGGIGNADGTSGTASNFGGLVIANGGAFSSAGSTVVQSGGAGGAAGTVPSGGLALAGQTGGNSGDNNPPALNLNIFPIAYTVSGGITINGTSNGSFSVNGSATPPGLSPSGAGGNSVFGQGGFAVSMATAPINGIAGLNYGSGGSGATAGISGIAANGGAGAPGVIIVTEFSLS